MAILDPRDGPRFARASQRFTLHIHEVALEDIVPNGDRYVVEVLDLDEKIELGSILVVTQEQPQRPGDPQADPTIERRGVIAAVVIRAGNGHLLGLPDLAPQQGGELVTGDGGHGYFPVDRPPASVPMFFDPGDVVLIDHNAKGRALKILGREGRIVNQIDVLADIEGINLHRVNGEWVAQE